MLLPSPEQQYDELFRLLEVQNERSQRSGTLNEAEMGKYRDCRTRIEHLVQELAAGSGGRS
jgi:hypothetical protein